MSKELLEYSPELDILVSAVLLFSLFVLMCGQNQDSRLQLVSQDCPSSPCSPIPYHLSCFCKTALAKCAPQSPGPCLHQFQIYHQADPTAPQPRKSLPVHSLSFSQDGPNKAQTRTTWPMAAATTLPKLTDTCSLHRGLSYTSLLIQDWVR